MSAQPGSREVAYRLFAAEYGDADLKFSESDEERAPNYVVTPSGARVNRLFFVGVLTELEQVNEEMLRARIVDPTGAFVVYAGQYQPDELAFLERVEPPTFLAVTGKARTFQPEDSDRVYTSVRPESINVVDAETRDRWVVDTARRTLHRVGVAASAVQCGLSGDTLQDALEASDVDGALAQGVTLALDHYETTPAYLAALRETAIGAARVVAGEREEAPQLGHAPGQGDGDAAGLATLDLSGVSPDQAATPGESQEQPETADGEGTSTAATTEPTPDDESPPVAPDVESSPDSVADGESTAGSTDAAVPDDADAADAASESTSDDEFDPDAEVLGDNERQEIAEEYGTEFATGGEVESEPASAAETSDAIDADATGGDDGSATESTKEPTNDESAEPESDATSGEVAADQSAKGAVIDGDLDPSEAVIELMRELDDGEGADREAVVDAAVDEYGLDIDVAENAIKDAMMSGQAYEPAEGRVKPI